MTDTARDLIAAIHANPEEDSVRLVYADYLQETGDEMRAELIRVQIELHNKPCHAFMYSCHELGEVRCKCNDSPHYKELRSRELWLFTCNRSVLLPKCPVCVDGRRIRSNLLSPAEAECDCFHCKGTSRVGKLERGLLTTLPVYFNWAFEEQGGLYATNWAVDTLQQFPEVASMPLMGVDECLAEEDGFYYWRQEILYEVVPGLPDLLRPLIDLSFKSKKEALYALGVRVVQQIRKRGSQS